MAVLEHAPNNLLVELIINFEELSEGETLKPALCTQHVSMEAKQTNSLSKTLSGKGWSPQIVLAPI